MDKKIYLDNNATTSVHPEVREAMLPYLGEIFGNPSSVHAFGQLARKAVEDSREKLAALIGAKTPEEVVFTSCGTEANNFALKGLAWQLKDKGNQIITSAIEHHAVLIPCQYLEKQGFKITYLPVNRWGEVDLEVLKKEITAQTILISIMHANNEIGTIQPIESIAQIAHEQKILFHTDAVQTVGKLPIDVEKMGIDLLSLSAHKFYGPKGAGALYIRRGIKLNALLHGGHHERNRRAGTENVSGVVGMAVAAELAVKNSLEENKRLVYLRNKLERGILEKISHVRLNGHPENRLSNTANFVFEFIEGEGLVLSLDFEGIALSTGSACTSGTLEPSHVLKAIGVPAEISQGSLRFSLGYYNTEEDVDYVLQTIPRLVNRLREMSPLWEDKLKGITTKYADDKHQHEKEE
ncbi:MAG: cysteine desulfurase NifS [Elusimicrobiota bacterium]